MVATQSEISCNMGCSLKSNLTFNGIGHIIKGAKGADAQQESRVLLLQTKHVQMPTQFFD